MSQKLLIAVARRFVKFGRLRITFADGSQHSFGPGTGGPDVGIAFTDPDLPKQIVLNPDLALGEAYMDGTMTIEGDDLRGFLGLLIRNVRDPDLGVIPNTMDLMRGWVRSRLGSNPLVRAQRNVAHHFAFDAEPGAAGEQPVVGIPGVEFLADLRRLPIRGRVYDQPVQSLEAPAAIHQLAGQPIQ